MSRLERILMGIVERVLLCVAVGAVALAAMASAGMIDAHRWSGLCQ